VGFFITLLSLELVLEGGGYGTQVVIKFIESSISSTAQVEPYNVYVPQSEYDGDQRWTWNWEGSNITFKWKPSQTSLSHSLSTHTPCVSADQKSRTLNLINSTRDSMKLMLSQKGGTYLVTKNEFRDTRAQRCLLASQSCTWVSFRPWYGLRRCPRELKKRVLMASETALTVHRVRLLRRHNEKMGFKGCLGTFTRRWHLQTSGIRYTAVFYWVMKGICEGGIKNLPQPAAELHRLTRPLSQSRTCKTCKKNVGYYQCSVQKCWMNKEYGCVLAFWNI